MNKLVLDFDVFSVMSLFLGGRIHACELEAVKSRSSLSLKTPVDIR